MGTTLQHGIFLPAEGERNCYAGLAANWTTIDGVIGGYNVHIGNATIHVTAADKEAWNGKADDASVMHLTGNETAEGNKTFNGDTNCVGELNQTAPFKMASDTSFVTGTKNTRIYDQNGFMCVNELVIYNNSKNIRRAWYLYNNSTGATVSAGFNFILAASGQKVFYPLSDNDTDNGSSSAYWKNTYSKQINSVSPGALFLPQDRSARMDISAYFTNTASGDSNQMTVPADGWIYLALDNVVIINLVCSTSGELTNYADSRSRASVGSLFVTFPVRKNDVFKTTWYTTAAAVTVSNAFFIPCKGNI